MKAKGWNVWVACLVGWMCLAKALLGAQTVVNPKSMTFQASTDHGSVDGTGAPILDHYDVTVMTATGIVFTSSLGKPSPNSSGQIALPLPAAILALANGVVRGQSGPSYTLTVSAVSLDPKVGSSPSQASNPFVFAVQLAPPGKPVLQ